MGKHKDNKQNNNEINSYQKRGFIKNLPFGLKATFIKYWFYGALYFFCFMGLGTFLQNENLILVTGLIGGVLFDIALYNIFLLFAETREEASNWWIYKSKKFYSVLINIVVILGLLFAFYYIIVPIKAAMGKGSPFWWLFQEPLSAALLLTTLDTALCWLKNLIIIAVRKILKLGNNNPVKKADYIKLLDVSPVTATLEINNEGDYFTSNPYNVFLDNEIILKKVNTNVFTIYDLKPDTQYKVTINKQNFVFNTSKISKFYKAYEGNDIQYLIDNADQYSLIVVNKGTYKINRLNLKSNIVLYLRKGAILTLDTKDSKLLNKDERYKKYYSKDKEIIQPIINIDNIRDIKIVGEGIIDGESLLSSYKEKNIISPNLLFINHSTNIVISGLTFKNSPSNSINTFFSNNINLLNLEINNSNNFDGINAICSSSINILGCHILNGEDAIAIKSGNVKFENEYHSGSKDIVIRNCYIEKSLSGVALGNKSAGGIYSINVTRCNLNKTNYGIIIKSNFDNGVNAIIKDINIKNITMDKVHAPLVINMLHGLDLNKQIKTNYDVKKTPFVNNINIKNINAKEYSLTAGFFYGLNEKYIGEISISDSTFICIKESAGFYSNKLIDISKCSKAGFIVKNVRTFELNNVKVINHTGKKIDYENISELIDK